MKRFLVLSVLLVGIGLATPALAGYGGHSRGHRVVQGGYRSCSVYGHRYPRYAASAYFHVARPWFSFGWYAPAPAYYYGPPVYVDAGYYGPA